MKDLEIFKNEEFGEIQIIEENGKFEFEATGTAKMLGYTNPHDAIQRHCKRDGVVKHEVGVQTGLKKDGTPIIQMVEKNFIDEGNLYRLITHSKLPSAEKFESWVFDEVLPSIRKTGGYIAGEEDMTEDELVLKAMQVMQNKLAKLEKKTEKLETENRAQFQLIGELKPKADYTDRILHNKALVTMTAIAKDYGMSSQKMNDKLHELGVQYKQSGQWFLYEKYHDNGYTHSETIDLTHKDGTEFVKMNTKWTQKGRLFLYNLLKDNGIVPIIEQN